MFLNPTEVKVVGPEVLHAWREAQRVAVPGAKFTPRFKRGLWDGTHAPGRWCRRVATGWELRASRGILGRLQSALPVVIAPNGVVPPVTPDGITNWLGAHPTLPSLRDYQQLALRKALVHQWGRVALATNAGKGAVIALLAQFGLIHQLPVLILCDEIAVFDALRGELDQWADIRPGTVEQGVTEPPYEAVVLAMVPTLVRRLDSEVWVTWLQRNAMVLLDEADKATAPTWREILSHTTQSHWRVGFSGTFPDPAEDPFNDLRLDELMGPVLVRAKNIDLVNRGVSARPTVVLHKHDVTAAVAHPPREWFSASGPERRRWVFEQGIVYNQARHAQIAALVHPGVPTAVIVNRIDHGEALAAALPGSIFLDGSVDAAERKRVLEQFQRGEVRLIIVTKILDRGTNRLGSVADLIFASGEGSDRQTLQRIGRGLRRADGKEFLRLVDVIDGVTVDGTAPAFRKRIASYVHSAGQKRVRLYHTEGFDITLPAAGGRQ